MLQWQAVGKWQYCWDVFGLDVNDGWNMLAFVLLNVYSRLGADGVGVRGGDA